MARMAAPNRNQHWVPQFYLRYFATPETRDSASPKIWAFPIHAGEEFVTSPRNVAAKRDLYSFCTGKVDEELAALEGTLRQYWPTLTEKQYPIDLGFRRGISLFIATLYMRHPATLDRQRRFATTMKNALALPPQDTSGHMSTASVTIRGETYAIDPVELEEFRASTDEDIKANWGTMILSTSGWLAQQLVELPWTVLVRDEPAFITTDQPVTLINSNRDNTPILHPDTVIYFPLSTTKLVVINQNRHRNSHIVQIARGHEAVFNYILFRSAYQHVFSAWDSIYLMDQVVRFGDWARAEQGRFVHEARRAVDPVLGRNDRCYCGSGLKFKRCCYPR